MRLAFAGVMTRLRQTGGLPRLLPFLILLAFLLRLATGSGLDHAPGYQTDGGDSTWYLANGYALMTGFDQGRLPGYGVDTHPDGLYIALNGLTAPPLYLVFIGSSQALFPREIAVWLIRAVQALLGAATVWLVWRLGRKVTGNPNAAFVAAAALAISPAFIYESAQIATETLYIFLLLAALTHHSERPGRVAVTGLLLGLAALTRAVLLLFPLGIAIHLLLLNDRRQGLRRALLLLAVYSLVVSSWTLYSLARWDRFVIAGEGLAAFLYISAQDEGWQGAAELDSQLLADTGELPAESPERQGVYIQGAQQRISADPAGHLLRRLRELTGALLQPFGTGHYDGPPLRLLAQDWLRDGIALADLLRMTAAQNFWPRLLIYLLHFGGLLAGLAGLWLTRQRWRQTLPLAGFIAYTLLLHLALYAIPRYLFPTLPLWWVFAGAAFVAAAERLRASRA